MYYNKSKPNDERLEQQAKLIFELECQMHDVKKRLDQLEESAINGLIHPKEKS